MATYRVSKSFDLRGEIRKAVSNKVAQVCRMFGVTIERLSEIAVEHSCELRINDGDIVYITGPSGSGKSVLMKELEKLVPACERKNLADVELSEDKAVIDCIEGDFVQSLRLLSTAGLNDVFCVINRPANLSDGQKYRFRLAAALSGGAKFIFADEFCSNLDRITAAVVCYNVRRFAKRHKVTFVLASSHNDTLADLQPDVLVVKELSGGTEVMYMRDRTGN